MLFSLKLNPKGLIPEVPFRPKSKSFIDDSQEAQIQGDDSQ